MESFELTKSEFIADKLFINSISEAEQLHDLFIKLRTTLAVERGIIEIMPHYRGEQNSSWDIRSGIFRPPLNISDPVLAKQLESKGIQEFERVLKERIGNSILREIFNDEKFGREWDLLIQAQHAGVKTTLTDWTAFILSALFFATEQSDLKEVEVADGQIWIFLVPVEFILGHNDRGSETSFYTHDPSNMQGTYLINPSTYLDNVEKRLFEYRMFKQKGRFIMSANDTCHIPLNKQDQLKPFIIRAIIPAANKQKIREELQALGITRDYMFVEENQDHQNLIVQINKDVFGKYGAPSH